jgi:hypothetical protein
MTQQLATDKQVQYLASLWETIARGAIAQDGDNGPEYALVMRERADDLLTGRVVLGKREASEMIETAKTAAAGYRIVRNANAVPRVTEGLYIVQDTIYKVVLSARGNLYAKRLVPSGRRGRFEYAPNALSQLSPENALTAELAAEYGRKMREGGEGDGVLRVYCACCGAELDTEESRERGIGPVCYRQNFCR